MTRVLMTADTLGGVWTYALHLARGLSRHGIELHLATMGRLPTRAQLAQAGQIRNLVLHTSDFRLCWMDDPWDDVERAGEWLLQIAHAVRPELVHLNDFGHASLPWPAPVLLVAHSCVLSWWQAVHGAAPPREWQRYAERVHEGLHRADIIVAPTQAMADALRTHYGPLHAVRVVYNGMPHGRCACGDMRETLILSAGRLWDHAKNVRALAAIADALPWPVVVAGEGGGSGTVEPANLRLTGQLDAAQLAQYYERAAIFALPARYEPFGLAALEAASRGCALVLGDIPSLREVWGDAAQYVPPDDCVALSETVRALIDDPGRLRRYGRRAASHARSYNLKRMTRGYLGAYLQLQRATARRTA